MLHRIPLAPEVKGVKEASTHSAHSVAHGSHDNDYSKPVSELNCERCKALFNKYVKISENAYQVLDGSTRTVSQSHGEHSFLWHDSKKLRIPSSKCCCAKDSEGQSTKICEVIFISPRFKGTADTRHGTLSELKARKDFESECLGKRNIALAGTIVSRTEPYFSCSPDGIIDSLKPICELNAQQSQSQYLMNLENMM